jgi:hypothetical protein
MDCQTYQEDMYRKLHCFYFDIQHSLHRVKVCMGQQFLAEEEELIQKNVTCQLTITITKFSKKYNENIAH